MKHKTLSPVFTKQNPVLFSKVKYILIFYISLIILYWLLYFIGFYWYNDQDVFEIEL